MRRTQPIDQAAVVVGAVLAVHQSEDAIRPRLHRQMEERHQVLDLAVRFDQIVRHVARMRCGVAETVDTRHLGEGTDQLPQTPVGAIRTNAVVGVDVLTQQGEFAHPDLGQPAGFRHDSGHGAGIFGTRV